MELEDETEMLVAEIAQFLSAEAAYINAIHLKDGMIEKTVEAGSADSQEETAEVEEVPTIEEKTEDNII